MLNRMQIKQLPQAQYDKKGNRIPGSGYTPNSYPNRATRRSKEYKAKLKALMTTVEIKEDESKKHNQQ